VIHMHYLLTKSFRFALRSSHLAQELGAAVASIHGESEKAHSRKPTLARFRARARLHCPGGLQSGLYSYF
jgi:hypothetical protein